ncbi:MAG: hydroxymethylglutaryl-CoA reductase [Bacteroidales bacterium]|nr:hydroxymethylglutaryl-CoA reductase [Bacteroidales bacterium]
MGQTKAISGFSKFTPEQKTAWLKEEYGLPGAYTETLASHLHSDPELQARYNEFSENTISNFFIPYGLAPNFLINNRWYVVPMAIEESSVVAAASHAAKFWSAHGGFKAEVIDPVKTGQVHFHWTGETSFLQTLFIRTREKMIHAMDAYTASMRKRGGGIKDIRLEDRSGTLANYYQLSVEFRTADAMGANFINTVLEALAKEWEKLVADESKKKNITAKLEIIMAILSNYTPDSLVRIWVESGIASLGAFDNNLSGSAFAEKFVRAVEIARADTSRAVTHNKGIFNGMDGVVIATGNDFRAVEACGHAYASRDGKYRSLSTAEITGNTFHFTLEIPMSVGTVGGLTSGHPLAETSLKILQDPGAEEVMMVVAAAGLANNFSAVRSLITSGIQKGHMKMHLTNILRQLGASNEQKRSALEFFSDKTISYAAVKKFLALKK